MKAGNVETKTGRGQMPNPLDTIVRSLKLIFFNEKAMMSLMLNRKHTFNILFMYGVSLVIPFRGLDGSLRPADFGQIVESVLLTFVYIGLIYLYLPKKPGVFTATMRVILSFEAMSVFLPITFMMDEKMLSYFHPAFLAWYLSLSVFAVSKIKGYGYVLSTIVVFAAFIVTVLFPAFFV